MDKIIYQDSNEMLMEAVAKNGEAMATLLNFERGVKSAASSAIDKKTLESFRPENDDHAVVHLIAMGAGEAYGPNRNGDWFASDVLEKRANTFVKYGHVFREHRNKDPKKALGVVKAATFNRDMQRVELIIDIEKDKAPAEFEKLASGNPMAFSMSCRVPNDRCSCCGNEAKSVDAYCDHLKNHMNQWQGEFKKYAYAINDQPTFFDISFVAQPADRTAYGLQTLFKDKTYGTDMQKAASAASNLFLPSALAAELEGVNLGNGYEIEEQHMLVKLAAAEDYAADSSNINKMYIEKRANAMFGSFPFALMDPFSQEEMETVRTASVGTLMRELANRMCMLSFPAFCQMCTGDHDAMSMPICQRAACELPGAFKRIKIRMYSSPQPITKVFRMSSSFMADQDPVHDKVQNIMDKVEDRFSLQPERVVIRIVDRMDSGKDSDTDKKEKLVKKAMMCDDIDRAANIANMYAEYQLRALCDMKELHGDDSVPDTICDMVAGANTALVY